MLREGRHLGEIESFLIVTQVIAGALLVMFSLLFLAGTPGGRRTPALACATRAPPLTPGTRCTRPAQP